MPAIASTHPPSTAVSNCSRLLFHGWSNHPAGVMLFNHTVNANAPYPRAEAFAVLFMAALSCESALVSGERARLPTIVDTACVERVTTARAARERRTRCHGSGLVSVARDLHDGAFARWRGAVHLARRHREFDAELVPGVQHREVDALLDFHERVVAR